VTRITLQGGKLVLRDGAIGTEQACCCGDGVCCLPDGTCASGYATQEECEECVPDLMCFNEETFEFFPVESCEECDGFCYEEGTTGPCGTWRDGKTCDTANCDCPEFGEEILVARACGIDDDPAGIQNVIDTLTGCGFSNVRAEFEEQTGFYAFYGTCCSESGAVLASGQCGGFFCGVPYQGVSCSANPLP
jgi:hypothetical protein